MIQFDHPIRDGIERTKRMLFPFDFKKWIGLAFCAWLAAALGGGGGFNWSSRHGWPSSRHNFLNDFHARDHLGLVVAIVFCAAVIIFAVVLLLTWLAARGRFMLLDNVIHDRALVAKPWKEFKAPANNLFFFYLVLFVITLAIIGVVGALGFLALGLGHAIGAAVALAGFCLFFLFWILVCLFFVCFQDFAPAIMYKTGGTAMAALVQVWEIVSTQPLTAFLYVLMRIVLGIAFLVISTILCLLTCCLGCLPFVNSFITLPLAVFRQSFILDCLRQFDPRLDLWIQPVTPPDLPVS